MYIQVVVFDTWNGHRPFSMLQMIHFDLKVEYYAMGMFWMSEDRYALYHNCHGEI